MRIIGIVGTNSDKSTNRDLLRYMQRHFGQDIIVEICEIAPLPAFDEPESNEVPEAVGILSEKINQADGVIIATPEYDHTITAALKSAIEWFSYTSKPFVNKPVMIVGASYGALGSSRAQAHLRQILDSPDVKARVLPSSEFLLGHSLQAFDEQGDLVDSILVKQLEETFEEFMMFIEITSKLIKEHQAVNANSSNFSWKNV